jgi:hypothetical protein
MTTRHLFLAAILVAAPLSASAEVEGFGGPTVAVTQLADETAVLFGGRGGALFNGKYILGGSGFGLANSDLEVGSGPGGRPHLTLGYGGAWLGYMAQRDGTFDFLIHTTIGAGSVGLEGGGVDRSDSGLLVEPGADLVWKPTDSLRVSVGASYRFFSGIEVRGLEDDDVNGPSLVIGVTFGSY